MPRSRFPETLKVLTLISGATLAACASDKTPPPALPKPLSGEQILRESQGMAQLGQRYMEGEALVRKGDEMVRQGQAKITEGERLIEQGRNIMKESEQGYGELKK
jgi:hypothetical protein